MEHNDLREDEKSRQPLELSDLDEGNDQTRGGATGGVPMDINALIQY